MKTLLQRAFAIAVVSVGSVASAQDMTGAGATFPAPVYAKWADAYNKATGARLNYQSVGSGAGIQQIRAKTVDFGASDQPLTDEVLAKDGLIQFPTVIGGVVPVVNIKGIAPGQIKLKGQLLGDIYLGKITKWNDAGADGAQPRRAAARRGDLAGAPRRRLGHLVHLHELSLEDQPRLEGQGRRGHRRQLADRRWRQGQRGRRRVRAAAAELDRLRRVRVRQAEQDDARAAAGTRTATSSPPDADNFKAAAAGADWSKTFFQVLTDQPGKDAWPISGATFILMHKVPEKPANVANALKFFDWAFTNGDKMADELEYVPLPAAVKDLVRKSWAASVKDASGKAIAWK